MAEGRKSASTLNHKKGQRDKRERDQIVVNICCVPVHVCVVGASYLSLCGPLNMTSCHLGSQTQGGGGGSSSWLCGKQKEEEEKKNNEAAHAYRLC